MTALSIEAVEQQILNDEAVIQKLTLRVKSLRELHLLLKDSKIPVSDDLGSKIETTRQQLNPCVTPTTPAPAAISDAGVRRGRKPKGELSLANMILLALADSPEGLTSSEIIRAVLKMGYKTGSDDFQRVVGSTLSNLKAKNRLVRSESGVYMTCNSHVEKDVLS